MKEITSIADSMQEILSGEPWYGKSCMTLFNEIDASTVYQKPTEGSHSLIELLYHMVTWAEFTQHRLEKDKNMDMQTFEALDWRRTNPEIHTWNSGIADFTVAINKIIQLLKNSDDTLLEDIVDYRDYNFRYLLNGLIQHNIYHLGQMAYLKKSLE